MEAILRESNRLGARNIVRGARMGIKVQVRRRCDSKAGTIIIREHHHSRNTQLTRTSPRSNAWSELGQICICGCTKRGSLSRWLTKKEFSCWYYYFAHLINLLLCVLFGWGTWWGSRFESRWGLEVLHSLLLLYRCGCDLHELSPKNV